MSNSEILEWDLRSSDTAHGLAAQITVCIQKGWQPFGEPRMVSEAGGRIWFQAVARYAEYTAVDRIVSALDDIDRAIRSHHDS